MATISRVSLFSKLNLTAFRTVEGATVLCKLRGNPYVEPVHWLAQILRQDDSDIHRVLRHFSTDCSQVLVDVQKALEGLPAGAQGISDLSASLISTVEKAWLYASLGCGAQNIRTAHVLLALLNTESLLPVLLRMSPCFKRVCPEELGSQFDAILAASPEQAEQSVNTAEAALPSQAGGAMPAALLGAEQALKKYTTDLTEQARQGKIDPVTGRENEVRQMVDILLRRRQNNPLITGEAGVGKTAVVEGFALQIAMGQVPPALKHVRVLSLDLGLLQAGASMKGEFEQRLRQLIEEIQASECSTILFIDEVHTLMGAGGNQGTGDAANLLKPALARGTLRTIGATTWSEYKKYIEKDAALTRRFQVVQVEEPDETNCIRMLRGLAPAMQAHHGVYLFDEAIQAAVRLSHRYIPARQLPDKAVSLLDTACARVAVSQHATPGEIEQVREQIHALQAERNTLGRESRLGRPHSERLKEVETQLSHLNLRLTELETRFQQEKSITQALWALRSEVEPGQAEAGPIQDPSPKLNQLQVLEDEVRRLQGETPLIHPHVDAQSVAAVVADWTGIPVGRMLRNEVEHILNLSSNLGTRIVGQTHALETIARRVQTSRAGLDDPDKPVGVFLLAGTSGVGKTETALALAETLYGGEHNLITINMNEYQEAHTVSALKGAPPGYVGYGQGGVLTEAVRRRPYCVLLLDEIEKAHPDVHELFFQVFDKGWMEDGEGRRIDFRNSLILLTTNTGTEVLMGLHRRALLGGVVPQPTELVQALRAPLLQVFPAALLGRLEVVPYSPLSTDLLARIVELQLARIQQRVSDQHGITVTISPCVVQQIVARCHESDSGARLVGSILSNTLLPVVSCTLLKARLEGQPVRTLHIRTEGAAFVYDCQ